MKMGYSRQSGRPVNHVHFDVTKKVSESENTDSSQTSHSSSTGPSSQGGSDSSHSTVYSTVSEDGGAGAGSSGRKSHLVTAPSSRNSVDLPSRDSPTFADNAPDISFSSQTSGAGSDPGPIPGLGNLTATQAVSERSEAALLAETTGTNVPPNLNLTPLLDTPAPSSPTDGLLGKSQRLLSIMANRINRLTFKGDILITVFPLISVKTAVNAENEWAAKVLGEQRKLMVDPAVLESDSVASLKLHLERLLGIPTIKMALLGSVEASWDKTTMRDTWLDEIKNSLRERAEKSGEKTSPGPEHGNPNPQLQSNDYFEINMSGAILRLNDNERASSKRTFAVVYDADLRSLFSTHGIQSNAQLDSNVWQNYTTMLNHEVTKALMDSNQIWRTQYVNSIESGKYVVVHLNSELEPAEHEEARNQLLSVSNNLPILFLTTMPFGVENKRKVGRTVMCRRSIGTVGLTVTTTDSNNPPVLGIVTSGHVVSDDRERTIMVEESVPNRFYALLWPNLRPGRFFSNATVTKLSMSHERDDAILSIDSAEPGCNTFDSNFLPVDRKNDPLVAASGTINSLQDHETLGDIPGNTQVYMIGSQSKSVGQLISVDNVNTASHEPSGLTQHVTCALFSRPGDSGAVAVIHRASSPASLASPTNPDGASSSVSFKNATPASSRDASKEDVGSDQFTAIGFLRGSPYKRSVFNQRWWPFNGNNRRPVDNNVSIFSAAFHIANEKYAVYTEPEVR